MKQSMHGFLRRSQFFLERLVQRGILSQLLLMAMLVVAVAVIGGVAAWALTPGFESLGVAVWWSFLRLTDPGYLGDDQGALLRVIATIVTVLGYVLFMGSLIAIMTQWLAYTIRKLESGLTPIAMEHHFVILGWTNRTSEIIKKLLTAEGRMGRFLARRAGAGKLRVVVLADEVNAQLRQDLRDGLGSHWNESQIFLRSGSSLQREHLERLDLQRAAVIMIPGADFALGGAELMDTRVVKTLLTLDGIFRAEPTVRPPHVIVELFDPRKASIARDAIGARTEIIVGDRLISRLFSQSLRHTGVANVLIELLSHREGNTLYLRSLQELAGSSPRALVNVFPQAVVLGVVSMEDGAPSVHLDPARDVVLKEDDRLIFLAESYEHCKPTMGARAELPASRAGSLAPVPEPAQRRLLILGWSYKIPALLEELLASSDCRFVITILSKVVESEREKVLDHLDLTGRLTVEHVVGDYSLERDLVRVEPHRFNHVLFLASGSMQSSEEADARTILGLLLLRSLLRASASGPEVLVELLDPDNASILGEAEEVVFVSTRMLSHLLAHVGLLPELNAVFDALICTGGTEIELRRLADLGIDGERVTFTEVQLAAASLGCVGLGFFVAPEPGAKPQVFLNPAHDQSWSLASSDRVVLLRSEGDAPT